MNNIIILLFLFYIWTNIITIKCENNLEENNLKKNKHSDFNFNKIKLFDNDDNNKKIYKLTYNRYNKINFCELDLLNVTNVDFGKVFTFSPLDDFCKNDFEKSNAKKCLLSHPDNWNCIYDYCISPSKPHLTYFLVHE